MTGSVPIEYRYLTGSVPIEYRSLYRSFFKGPVQCRSCTGRYRCNTGPSHTLTVPIRVHYKGPVQERHCTGLYRYNTGPFRAFQSFLIKINRNGTSLKQTERSKDRNGTGPKRSERSKERNGKSKKSIPPQVSTHKTHKDCRTVYCPKKALIKC